MHLRVPPSGRGRLSRPRPFPRLAALAGILLLLLLGSGGCQPPSRPDGLPQVQLAWELAPEPHAVGPATLQLTLTEAGRPVSGAAVKIEAGMTHPGMRSIFATAREGEPGSYRANFELTMAGDWFLLAGFTLRDGRRFERQLDLPGVR